MSNGYPNVPNLPGIPVACLLDINSSRLSYGYPEDKRLLPGKGPTFLDEIVAAPKGHIGKISKETNTTVFMAPRPPQRLNRGK